MREAAETRSYAAALSVLTGRSLSTGLPARRSRYRTTSCTVRSSIAAPSVASPDQNGRIFKKELGGRRNGPEGRNIRVDEKAQPPALGEERRHVVFRFARDSTGLSWER
jgi:hypothetical protein